MHVVHLQLFAEAQMAPYGSYLFLYSTLISEVAKHLGVGWFPSELMNILACKRVKAIYSAVWMRHWSFSHKALYVWGQCS